MSQIEKKATGCACGTSGKASTPPAGQEGTCPCGGESCACRVEGTAAPQGGSCCCGG